MSTPPKPEELDVVSDDYMRLEGGVEGSNRRLSVCRALGQVYLRTEDPELRLKLRYAATLARHYVFKLREFDPEWIHGFCPRYRDYHRIMKRRQL